MKPSDDAIVMAALVTAREWLCADEIRGRLRRLGFQVSAQQVAGWLGRLAREYQPRFEARIDPWSMVKKTASHVSAAPSSPAAFPG